MGHLRRWWAAIAPIMAVPQPWKVPAIEMRRQLGLK